MGEKKILWIVVMTRPPIAGKVKTRLIGDMTDQQAAKIHQALMSCVMTRLVKIFSPIQDYPVRFGLAVDGGPAAWPSALPHEPWELLDQGDGDLGQRLETVWGRIGKGPVMFFGVDSPDVPRVDLENMIQILTRADAVVGPVADGGYWTLAASQFFPQLLMGIDWGSANVYHQTIQAARDARIDLASGAHWYDVDTPEDLASLRHRLTETHDADLIALREQLDAICEDQLDMNTTSQSPAQENASDQMDLSTSTILIVDDNAQNVELMQAYLEELGCKTFVAYDGLEAMQWIENNDEPMPDLILLDVMMPRMSGFEVCTKLKEDPNTRAIPIMMVTALNELGDIERGVESGTDDFVTKPVNKLELLTRVKSLLRVRHLKRELDRTMAYIQDIEKREQSDE
ncbi:MAG: hypothetical protein CMJ19_16865 [Phycisphaeraceae bacterium]|nr:hypothetical protein [Phycisphaeraceae bacterium]